MERKERYVRERGLSERENLICELEMRFGQMLESEELQSILGEKANIKNLVLQRRLVDFWPGENKPVYPYFQLNKGKIRPQIKLVVDKIHESSSGSPYSPLKFFEWIHTPIEGKKATPLDLMKQRANQMLLSEAEKFGKRLLPRKPTG